MKGVGPFYWGIEEDTADPKKASLAWMVETDPPYRKSLLGRSGVRVRIGTTAYHFGLCRRERDSDTIRQLGGKELDYEPRYIALWGQRVQQCFYCKGKDDDPDCARCLGTGYEVVDDEQD